MSEPVATNEIVPKVEDPSFNTVESVISISNSLVTLLQTKMKIPSYHLTEEQQSWISLLLKNSPQSFTKIDTDVTSIVASGSLGVHSIPQLVQLCADVINQASIQQGMSNAVNIYILIKFILDVLLDSSLIPLPDVEKNTIQILVDVSLGLLCTNLVNSPPIVSTKGCCK
jgi:hypothetical protein